jgi:multidrug efflux pump subunit AcrB
MQQVEMPMFIGAGAGTCVLAPLVMQLCGLAGAFLHHFAVVIGHAIYFWLCLRYILWGAQASSSCFIINDA